MLLQSGTLLLNENVPPEICSLYSETFLLPSKGPFKYYVSIFRGFSNPPTLCVLLVSKNGQFLNPPTQSKDYVIFEWSLK